MTLCVCACVWSVDLGLCSRLLGLVLYACPALALCPMHLSPYPPQSSVFKPDHSRPDAGNVHSTTMTGACFDQGFVRPWFCLVSGTSQCYTKWLNPVSPHGYCSVTGRRLISLVWLDWCLDPLLCVLAVSLDIRINSKHIDQSWLVHRLDICLYIPSRACFVHITSPLYVARRFIQPFRTPDRR